MARLRMGCASSKRSLLGLSFIIGCAGPSEPEKPKEPELTSVLTGEAPTNDVNLVVGSGDSASVKLRFSGVSTLHMGYFSSEEALAALGAKLGNCTSSADVVVSYNTENRIGNIVLTTGPRDLSCRPTLAADGWEMSALEPIGRALADYRDHIAATRDYRVSNFRVGVAYLRAANLCTLYISGQYPPDGSRWSPCVDFAGVPHCGVGTAEDGVTKMTFASQEDSSYLATCLGQ
jgi:hypothetical protein